jgi:hypothetical protein
MTGDAIEGCPICGIGPGEHKHNLSPAQWIECQNCGFKLAGWDETWKELIDAFEPHRADKRNTVSGYAVRLSGATKDLGVLETMGPTPRAAMVNWLYTFEQVRITINWTDEDILRAWIRRVNQDAQVHNVRAEVLNVLNFTEGACIT